MNIAEFFVKIGVTGENSIKKITNLIDNTKKAVIGMQIAFVGSVYAINKFISSTVQNSTSIENFKNQTGLAIEELNKWASAGKKTNSALTFETVKNNIAGIQKQLEQIKIGQGNIAPFQLLGIDINTNAFGVLEQIRKNIKGLSNPQAVNLIQQLGLDPNFINVLRLTDEQFEKLGQNSFLNGDQIQTVAMLGNTMNDLKSKLESLKDQAVAKLAPPFMKLLTDLLKWVERNSKKIIDTFSGLANIIAKIGTAVGRGAALFADLFETIIKTENGFTILAAALGALLIPFKPFALILTFILGLLEDIYLWKTGKENTFGWLYESVAIVFGKINVIIMSALENLKEFYDWLDRVSNYKLSLTLEALAAFGKLTLSQMFSLPPATPEEMEQKVERDMKKAQDFVRNYIQPLFESEVKTEHGRNVNNNIKNNINNKVEILVQGHNAKEIATKVGNEVENVLLESQLLR
jgi:acylphosphatase